MNHDQHTLYSSPIDKPQMTDAEYRTYVLMPIFARALAPYAGRAPRADVAVKAGMREVAQWWRAHGPRYQGQPDSEVFEDAVEAAGESARHAGFDESLIQAATPGLAAFWRNAPSRKSVLQGSGRRTEPHPNNSHILQLASLGHPYTPTMANTPKLPTMVPAYRPARALVAPRKAPQ